MRRELAVVFAGLGHYRISSSYGLSALPFSEPRRLSLLRAVRSFARSPEHRRSHARGPGGAAALDGDVLRSRRLGRALDDARGGGVSRAAQSLPRGCERGRATLLGLRRPVSWRRNARLFRLPESARGFSRSRRALRPRNSARNRGIESRIRHRASRPHRVAHGPARGRRTRHRRSARIVRSDRKDAESRSTAAVARAARDGRDQRQHVEAGAFTFPLRIARRTRGQRPRRTARSLSGSRRRGPQLSAKSLARPDAALRPRSRAGAASRAMGGSGGGWRAARPAHWRGGDREVAVAPGIHAGADRPAALLSRRARLGGDAEQRLRAAAPAPARADRNRERGFAGGADREDRAVRRGVAVFSRNHGASRRLFVPGGIASRGRAGAVASRGPPALHRLGAGISTGARDAPAGGDGGGRFALDRSLDAGSARASFHERTAAARVAAGHRASGFFRPPTRGGNDHAGTSGRTAGRGICGGRRRWKGAAGRDRPADCGEGQRRPAVRRGDDEDGDRDRPARGARHSFRDARRAAADGDSRHAARAAHGASRRDGEGARGGANRRRARANIPVLDVAFALSGR